MREGEDKGKKERIKRHAHTQRERELKHINLCLKRRDRPIDVSKSRLVVDAINLQRF